MGLIPIKGQNFQKKAFLAQNRVDAVDGLTMPPHHPNTQVGNAEWTLKENALGGSQKF